MGIRPEFWFLILSFYFLHATASQCFPYMTENIGIISPMDVAVVMEGGVISLNCTLNASYATNHSLTSRDVFWQRSDGPMLRNLTSLSDGRVKVTYPDAVTQTLTVRDAQMLDSATYGCSVVRRSGKAAPVCRAEVTVAGAPKKYKNFDCISENLLNLKCSWERGDNYPLRAATKYSLTYHMEGDDQEFKCPRPVPDGDASRQSSQYGCHWQSAITPGAMKLEKPLERPELMIYYNYYLTINGSNDLGSAVWKEKINMGDYVRPAAPDGVKVTMVDAHSCTLTWHSEKYATDLLSKIGLRYHVEYRKDGLESEEWQVYEDPVLDSKVVLNDLVAFSVYRVRISSDPKNSTHGRRSEFSEVTCNTSSMMPEGEPGLVEGAYEEMGNGLQRQVTLYWKGTPESLQNGPNFEYFVYLLENSHGEPRFLASTVFANLVIPSPANKSITVRVVPKNSIGSGNSEDVTIPAVRDHPLAIRFVNVVKFSPSLYEVSWGTSKPARLVDVYWCPTSLSTHLAKCTTVMRHFLVDGHKESINITVDGKHQYRFAVSARGDQGDNSGMTWKGRHCSVTDRDPWLDSLKVHSLANASVRVIWNIPCQHRFQAIRAYRVDFYPCREDTPTECVQDKFVMVENASEHTVGDLLPDRRYCFEVSVVGASNGSLTVGQFEPRRHAISKCLVTAPLPPVLPTGTIVAAVFGGALLLSLLAFLICWGYKRVRKDVLEIKKESQNVKMPDASLKRYVDEYAKEPSHYTKIDIDEEPYVRQLTSGVASLDTSDPETELLNPLLTGSNAAKPMDSGLESTFQTENELEPGSPAVEALLTSRPSFPRRLLGSADQLTVLAPIRPSSGSIGLCQSGESGISQGSSGYVAAASFQLDPEAVHSGQSSGAVSGSAESGYSSHPSIPSSSSDGSGPHPAIHDDSGASSGFIDAESPQQHRKRDLLPMSWQASHDPSVDSQEGLDTSPARSPTTHLPDPVNSMTKHAVQQPVGNGYVSWP